jgi:hypothetical protein
MMTEAAPAEGVPPLWSSYLCLAVRSLLFALSPQTHDRALVGEYDVPGGRIEKGSEGRDLGPTSHKKPILLKCLRFPRGHAFALDNAAERCHDKDPTDPLAELAG